MPTPSQRKPEYRVTLTFATERAAQAFSRRFMNTRLKPMPFTRDVYRITQDYPKVKP